MTPWRVLVVDSGAEWSFGASLARGFAALGHATHFFDQARFFPEGAGMGARALRRALMPVATGLLNAALVARAAAFRPDLVAVMKGNLLRPETLRVVQRSCGALVVFQNDDVENPLNTHAGMLESLPIWDVVFTPRRVALPELAARGVRRPEFLPFAYDPLVHRPAERPGPLAELAADRAVFVGTWAPERVDLFEGLVRRHPLAVWGTGWERVPDGSPLAPTLHRRAVLGADLAEVLTFAGADIALLRKANRDRHTMRTFEIPGCGGFLVGERTDEHQSFFEEGREAVFFDGPDELAAVLDRYLPDPAARARIAAAGRRRLLADGHRYEDRARRIVDVAAEVRR